MSVTLEESRVLSTGGMPADAHQLALDALRACGVRRQNARKNVGVARFAFNKLQLEMLPKAYRPPLSTIGGGKVAT